MATYVIGDIQGCYAELVLLLSTIQFGPDDTLWFTGDLVNRGPQSLEVLRFIKGLGEKHQVVLGNHDLYLLAIHYGAKKQTSEDTFNSILSAPDREDLMEWLTHRKLLHYDEQLQFVMSHAGLAPPWTLQKARELAHEVEMALQKSPLLLLENLFSNKPDRWDDQLSGPKRYRAIINYLTRMRFCYSDGRLDFSYKGGIALAPKDIIPWFDFPDRQNKNVKIVFGHWASLGGKTGRSNVYAVDTGCVWGNCLTAISLPDEKRFSVDCGKQFSALPS
jgi:bis(5'-nucleosyl)-tetraphosphatase (symmetrical)